MSDKFYFKEIWGEYKFYEGEDDVPLTENQIINKLNENEELKSTNVGYEDALGRLEKENEQLKQFQEQVAEVIESKMGDNVYNDYKMEVLKEIWNELELDKVWFE